MAEEVFEATYSADPRLVHEVRELIQRLIRGRVQNADELEEVKVAVSEAFSNAVCHGSPRGAQNRIGVRCRLTDEELVVEITDQGGGFQPDEIALPDFDEWKPSGRGLFLISALMDDVGFEPTADGTRVWMVKRLPAPDPESRGATSRRVMRTMGGGSFAPAAALMQELG